MKLIEIYKLFAQKLLLSGKNITKVKVILLLSMLGITIGVAALIIVMSIFNGFQEVMNENLQNVYPHVRYTFDGQNDDIDKECRELETRFDVKTYISVEERVMILSNNQVIPAMAVFAEKSLFESKYYKQFSIGNSNLSIDKGILIGGGLANKLKVYPGDKISLLTADKIKKYSMSFSFTPPPTFVIEGFFATQDENYNENYIFLTLNKIKFFNELSNKQYINIFANQYNQTKSNEIVNYLQKSGVIGIETWESLNVAKLSIMKLESFMTFVVLFIIVVIAVFNIFASQALLIISKRADFAILKTLGLDSRSIIVLVGTNGFLVGLIGLIFGLTIGIAFVKIQNATHFLTIDVVGAQLSYIPCSLYLFDIGITSFITFIAVALAAFLPAFKIYNLPIYESLKIE